MKLVICVQTNVIDTDDLSSPTIGSRPKVLIFKYGERERRRREGERERDRKEKSGLLGSKKFKRPNLAINKGQILKNEKMPKKMPNFLQNFLLK